MFIVVVAILIFNVAPYLVSIISVRNLYEVFRHSVPSEECDLAAEIVIYFFCLPVLIFIFLISNDMLKKRKGPVRFLLLVCGVLLVGLVGSLFYFEFGFSMSLFRLNMCDQELLTNILVNIAILAGEILFLGLFLRNKPTEYKFQQIAKDLEL